MRSEHVFDVVVIGGGLTGAAIARDAAMRGYATLLLEKEDFGAGATGRSSGLAQGGLRDLDLLDLGPLRRALAERATLERIAPHLVRPLACLRPVYAGDRQPLWMVGVGLKFHAWLARERRARARTIGAAEARRLEPRLEPAGLAGAALYTDGQILSPERLCLETVLSAREAGAKAVNHVAVTALRPRADGITEVDVESTLTGAADTVAGRVVVNAAGPWTDRLRRVASLTERPTVRLARRLHLAVRCVARHALVASARSDGRAFVVLPRRGWSVIATAGDGTDAEIDRVAATAAEVDDLLAEARRLLPEARLTQDDVFFARAGVEALALAPSGRT
ncbi:MAG TPA: FAD-dependent oxidoreductase, partial [Thermodesulfobacteriota bacterium]